MMSASLAADIIRTYRLALEEAYDNFEGPRVITMGATASPDGKLIGFCFSMGDDTTIKVSIPTAFVATVLCEQIVEAVRAAILRSDRTEGSV
jgi:hypothetical protein